MPQIIPVILAGGSGTRLWPLSRALLPKQFLELVTGRTMLQDTLLRAQAVSAHAEAPIIVCNEAHRFLVAEQARGLGVEPQRIVLEPAARNTAPAVAAAAELARRAAPADTDPILLVLPADHVVLDTQAFVDAVGRAIGAAQTGALVTFGIVPDEPETGYGYILKGESRGEYSVLERFVEKPDRATAETFLASGDYVWNSGMFLFSAGTYLAELGAHAPAMLQACTAAVAGAVVEADFTRLGEAFVNCPADSIDYAVMEKTHRAAVVELDAGWSDVGSWAAVHEIVPKDDAGNALVGEVIAEECRGCYIAARSRLVAAVGLEDLVVIETQDAVLVVPRARSQDVKRIVEKLVARDANHMRPRGEHEDR